MIIEIVLFLLSVGAMLYDVNGYTGSFFSVSVLLLGFKIFTKIK